jgi:hypothetical protein
MCTVLLPPGGYPIVVNKYTLSRHLYDHGSYRQGGYHSRVGIILGLALGYILSVILVNEILIIALFRAITQRVAVITCRRFGTTYQSPTFKGQ